MIHITICIGSACYMKGSRKIIDRLQELIALNHLTDRVSLEGSFCTGNCINAVCVTVDGKIFSLRPETTEAFFNNEILGRLTA